MHPTEFSKTEAHKDITKISNIFGTGYFFNWSRSKELSNAYSYIQSLPEIDVWSTKGKSSDLQEVV